MTGTIRCDSCGRDEPAAEVAAVRRVYVTPAAPPGFDAGGEQDRIQVLDEVEHWCFPCRSSYPHQLDGADEPEL